MQARIKCWNFNRRPTARIIHERNDLPTLGIEHEAASVRTTLFAGRLHLTYNVIRHNDDPRIVGADVIACAVFAAKSSVWNTAAA